MADNEYIKRSEVVCLIEEKIKRCDTVLETLAFASLRTKVMGLRSADVAPRAEVAREIFEAGYRKQIEAEWITDEKGYVTCSNCGEEHTWDEFRPPYCDMCGASMKGGE